LAAGHERSANEVRSYGRSPVEIDAAIAGESADALGAQRSCMELKAPALYLGHVRVSVDEWAVSPSNSRRRSRRLSFAGRTVAIYTGWSSAHHEIDSLPFVVER
jgi:hypothetical protein